LEAPAKIELETIRQLIFVDNPAARVVDVEQYGHQLLCYIEASESILNLGTITAHPRTAAPMENPYLKVRVSSLASMNRIKRLRRLDTVWTAVRVYLETFEKAARGD
jgi:hypothetical protein